jgi:hypothetical protein
MVTEKKGGMKHLSALEALSLDEILDFPGRKKYIGCNSLFPSRDLPAR